MNDRVESIKATQQSIETVRAQHDTTTLDTALQGAQMDAISRESQDRQYCIHCSTSVREREYDWKYIGVGGFLTGPFCGRSCQLGWLADE